jgi:4-aminobutyrate--pyruvate transaminase
MPWMHAQAGMPIPNILHIEQPYWFGLGGDLDPAEFGRQVARQLATAIEEVGVDKVAAFIAEPVQGAGGAVIPPASYWPEIQKICDEYGILLIADEVITGFGRTGKPFGCLTYDIKPDILVVSKQITSSYMPLAAILISDDLYQGIADNSAKIGTLGHGFTTSGHPVALAVALENLKVIEERKLMENAATVGVRLQKKLRDFADHPLVGEVRGVGLIAAVEFVADKASKTPFAATVGVAAYVAERAQEHGLLVRNIGDCVAFCPPMITTEAQIDEIAARFAKALADTAIWVKDKVSKSAA